MQFDCRKASLFGVGHSHMDRKEVPYSVPVTFSASLRGLNQAPNCAQVGSDEFRPSCLKSSICKGILF